MDIRRFSTIWRVGQEEWTVQEYSADLNAGKLTVKNQDQVVTEIDLDQWFAERLSEAGLSRKYSREELVGKANRFMICDTENFRLLFRRLTIDPAKNHIIKAEINFLLTE